MSYHLDIDGEAASGIEALPSSALPALAEAFTVLRLVPWNGQPYNAQYPERPMRTLTFDAGRGLIIYLVLERLGRVDVLQVTWFD